MSLKIYPKKESAQGSFFRVDPPLHAFRALPSCARPSNQDWRGAGAADGMALWND